MAKAQAPSSAPAAVPYLAGAAGVIVTVVAAVGIWAVIGVGLEAVRLGGLSAELLARGGLVLAVGAFVATPIAYLVGIPAALAIEWALRQAEPARALRIRYFAYCLAGATAGGILTSLMGARLANAVAITALAGGAAVAGAVAMQLAQRHPVIGRRVAITVPVVLAIAGFLVPD